MGWRGKVKTTGNKNISPLISGVRPYWMPEAESKEKHGLWGPMPELSITSPYFVSKVNSNTCTVPWETLCQSGPYPPNARVNFVHQSWGLRIWWKIRPKLTLIGGCRGKTLWDNGWLYMQYRNFWYSYPDSLILDSDPGFAEPGSNPDSDMDLDLDQDFCYKTSKR